MIQYGNTVPAIFVRRLNRFAAEVLIDGNTQRVHVKNTGRLRELLVPQAKVTLQKAGNPDRKSSPRTRPEALRTPRWTVSAISSPGPS